MLQDPSGAAELLGQNPSGCTLLRNLWVHHNGLSRGRWREVQWDPIDVSQRYLSAWNYRHPHCPVEAFTSMDPEAWGSLLLSKLDSIFWFKVQRDYAARPASLIELMAVQSIPHDIRHRLYLSTKKRQQCRRWECATIWVQEEVVGVFFGKMNK